jgi:hypothetical protein
VSTDLQRRHLLRNRVRDYALCIAIAFLLIFGAFVVEDRWGHEAFIRWYGPAGFTLALFGYFIEESGQFLRQRQFWALTAALLSLHVLVFAVVLTRVDEWRFMWFGVMAFESEAVFQTTARSEANMLFRASDRVLGSYQFVTTDWRPSEFGTH